MSNIRVYFSLLFLILSDARNSVRRGSGAGRGPGVAGRRLSGSGVESSPQSSPLRTVFHSTTAVEVEVEVETNVENILETLTLSERLVSNDGVKEGEVRGGV